MLEHLRDIQTWLRGNRLAGWVIPSTDEFHSEFPPPANRRLRWATGFRGSTGVAVILQDTAALFLDGRYRLQGASDTAGTGIVIEPATWGSRRNWLKRSLLPGARMGLDPWCHSTPDLVQWRSLADELGFELQMLPDNPIDSLWLHGRPAEHRPLIVDYPACYAGETYPAKCAALIDHVRNAGLQGLLVADPEDVSWMLNVRAAGEAFKTPVGEWHIVPSCTSRALVRQEGSITWFVDEDRLSADVLARHRPLVEIAPPDTLVESLRATASQGPVGVDPRRTPSALMTIIERESKARADDIIARRRWRKHANEIQSARRVHMVDAVAVVRFMAWLTHTVRERSVSEFQAAEALETFRAQHPDYKGPSEPLLAASGPSGANPHYIPRRESSRLLNEHPLFWMDSGGQYAGGSTDNTITLAVGVPEAQHIRAHTVVLKGFIALATAVFPTGTSSHRLDTIARHVLWAEGMDFPHNTGHGVGNYLNIHEGPSIGREPGPTTVPLEPGMIVTNEPGYYVPGDFGLRIESHMVVVASRLANFLEFETISRLPIDPRLVDFERLSLPERRWLADYHRTVLKDLESRLDAPSAIWLRAVVHTFVQKTSQHLLH